MIEMREPDRCIKEPYSIHAQAPGASEIKDIEMLKVVIVSLLAERKVRFPVNTKEDLIDALPSGAICACSYKGKTVTLDDLAKNLNPSDFPILNAGDAATLLASRCPIA